MSEQVKGFPDTMRIVFEEINLQFKYPTKVFRSFCLIFALSTTAFGSDFHSARTEALGGAGHAGPSLNDAIYLNPSFTSLIQTYSISFNFLSFDGGDLLPDGSNAIHGRNVNLSLLDGRSELFQAGVGYTRRDNTNQLTVGASKSFLEQLGVGVGGKFFLPTQPDKKVVRDTTLSVTFVPSTWVQMAAVIDNFLESDEGKARNLFREYILGTKFTLQNVMTVYFDPHWAPHFPGDSYGHEFGMELTFLQDFSFRLGSFKNSMMPHQDGLRGSGYGVGLGWVAPRLSLDYAQSHSIGLNPQVVHTFGATIFF